MSCGVSAGSSAAAAVSVTLHSTQCAAAVRHKSVRVRIVAGPDQQPDYSAYCVYIQTCDVCVCLSSHPTHQILL